MPARPARLGNSGKIAGQYDNRFLLGPTNTVLVIVCGLVIIAAGGCGGGPRPRNGYSPTTGGVPFPDPERLGNHSYGPGIGEASGIVYTKRGGSIDIDHLRGAADIARHAYDLSRSALLKGKNKFSVSPPFEYFSNKVEFKYPENWDSLSAEEKTSIATEVSLQVGQTVGYNSTLYHEMLTWFGTRFLLIPEFYSAFSWDDVYSNLVGTTLAMKAVQDPKQNYNQAMTRLLTEEMKTLGAVPRAEAIRITDSVKGKWFKVGLALPTISRKNVDAGFDDGYVSPALIPGASDAEPIDYAVPALDSLEKYGIEMVYTMGSAHAADRKMRKIAGTKGPLEPGRHFAAIMEHVRKEAVEKYGFDIGQ